MSNTQKKNVPELRFPGFEGEWEEKKLEDTLEFIKDGTHGTHENVNNGPWLLSAKNIKNNKIIISSDDRKISESDYKKIYKNYKLGKGDLLLTIVGTIGRVAIVKNPNNIAFQRSVAILKTKATYDVEFIFQLFQTKYFKNLLLRKQVVSAQPGLYLGDIRKIKISITNIIEEQRKIGIFFRKIDRQIELEEQKLELLQQQKKGYMQKIFSQELRFKDENGNDYPDWTNENFKDLFKVVPSKKYQIKSSEIIESGKIPVVDQGKKLILGFSNQTDKVYKEFNNVIIYGDHTTIIKKMDVPFIIGGDGVKLLTPISNNNLDYFFSILQYFNIESEGYKRHFSILKDKKFYTANSNKEQQKIGYFFKSLDLIINKQFTYLELLKSYKKGIIQKMFV
ncbi:restriction endonuclease subunit S [Staphylococcus aureus]|uniref:restriction endonuclease subunit S n=1 Tax=Staphylococcus aureus TaxID=1280 RepID=UPI0008D98ACC|nr:restriction endonuclease subunit S [Staphylococcus aureus]MBU6126122.1 restriction endonuclease subunit S [Staphylococcus aureus]MCJ8095000.1 restriction endonuclease subunit S [Staphylococcus aureus]OHW00873.1 restriction endonuclease subunit S [Staphylococcus aureus]SGS30915.1 type I restriction modification DNA specificity protein [Staphylococcus aureus]HCU6971315.1 restriction endonuclease subunit S [Staphylococcus aureus]